MTRTAQLLEDAMSALLAIANNPTTSAAKLRTMASGYLTSLARKLATAQAVVFLPVPCPVCRAYMLIYNHDFNIIDCGGCKSNFRKGEGDEV